MDDDDEDDRSCGQKFTLEIRLGNDAMRTWADVARALRNVAGRVGIGVDSGNIKDANGNTVGTFTFEQEEEARP